MSKSPLLTLSNHVLKSYGLTVALMPIAFMPCAMIWQADTQSDQPLTTLIS